MSRKTKEQKLQRQLKNTKRKLRRALPPDPNVENNTRAEHAKAALMAYRELTGAPRKNALRNLLCDLMHLCDQDRRYRTLKCSLGRAERQYQEQTPDPYF